MIVVTSTSLRRSTAIGLVHTFVDECGACPSVSFDSPVALRFQQTSAIAIVRTTRMAIARRNTMTTATTTPMMRAVLSRTAAGGRDIGTLVLKKE